MTDFTLKRGNTSPAIQATLTDGDGAAVVLTGATVRFHMRADGGDPALAADVDAPAVIVAAAGGQVRYDWAPADVDVAGWFRAEWEVTYGDGAVETFPNDRDLIILIREGL